MSITDEIERLKQLHQSGALTDAEFVTAKASVLARDRPGAPAPNAAPSRSKSNFLDPEANMKSVGTLIIVLLVGGGVGWYFMRQTLGHKQTDRAVATILKQPMELRDAIENLPASSWKGIPLPITYDGTLNVELEVVRGNSIDVYVLDSEDIDAFKAGERFHHYPAFEATKTKTYKRAGRLKSGGYILVLRDASLGILSASSSDIKVSARLAP